MMHNLEEISSGSYVQIVWFLGDIGRKLKVFMKAEEDDVIRVWRNDGYGIIIDVNKHRYALDNETAHAIKVIPA